MSQTLPAASQRRSAMSARVALFVVLASETFFFGTLLSAYFYMRAAQPTWSLASIGGITIPVANTLLLVLSVLPVALAGRGVDKGKMTVVQGWLLAALVMGLLFVGGQAFEFIRSGMRPNDPAFGGVFFTLMGFHALHMLAGIIVLTMLVIRARLGDFTPQRHVAIEVGSWFWFYVVGVWVVLFSALYVL